MKSSNIALFFTLMFTIPLSFPLSAQEKQYFAEQALFENGQSGYVCYRIPAIIKAPNGDLLAFAEGRVQNCHDFGDVDIVLKISKDNGNTWSNLQVVAENYALQAGNPAPLVDYSDPQYPNGRIFLVYNTGNASEWDNREGKGVREVWYITSSDNGRTWSSPQNITQQVHRPNQPDFNPEYQYKEDWRSYALTPGHALQLKNGRLFIPANHSAGKPLPGFNEYRSHAVYSDNHGQSWQLSQNVDIPSANEAIAAELPGGGVIMNIRQQNGEKRQRLIAISQDAGTSWVSTYFDTTLVGPVCQASLLNFQTPDGKAALLFSNPAHPTLRKNLTVRLSLDYGRTWPISRTVRHTAAAYSDLVIQEDRKIGLLYEHGNDGGIHFAHFNYSWLTGEIDE